MVPDVALPDESDTDVWGLVAKGRILALAGIWVGGLVAAAALVVSNTGGATPTLGFDADAPTATPRALRSVLADELDVKFGAWTIDPVVDPTGRAHGTLTLDATSRLAGAKSFELDVDVDVDVVDATGQHVLVDSLTVRQLGGGRTAKAR